jgi:uncharacterized protein (DUF2384 family)
VDADFDADGAILRHARQTFQERTRSAERLLASMVDDCETIAGLVEIEDKSLEEIRGLALKVWENPADAEEFLNTPHGLLDGQTPLAASRTEAGASRVREILLALEYGLPV